MQNTRSLTTWSNLFPYSSVTGDQWHTVRSQTYQNTCCPARPLHALCQQLGQGRTRDVMSPKDSCCSHLRVSQILEEVRPRGHLAPPGSMQLQRQYFPASPSQSLLPFFQDREQSVCFSLRNKQLFLNLLSILPVFIFRNSAFFLPVKRCLCSEYFIFPLFSYQNQWPQPSAWGRRSREASAGKTREPWGTRAQLQGHAGWWFVF